MDSCRQDLFGVKESREGTQVDEESYCSAQVGQSVNNETAPINKIQGLNENFFYNSMLARALLQILPHKDKKNVRLWLDKLADLDNDDEEIILRHEYMWFLLLMLQTKKVREPFTGLPPKYLLPLKDAVPRNIYEDVLLWNDQNSLAADAGPDIKAQTISEEGPPAKTSAPAKFLENQPWPKKGVICYLAAFSDRDL